MSKKKKINTKYSPELKISVIMDMRKHHLGYRETARRYNLGNNVCQGKNLLLNWERIYLEEGAAGFYIERRCKSTKMDNPKKGRREIIITNKIFIPQKTGLGTKPKPFNIQIINKNFYSLIKSFFCENS